MLLLRVSSTVPCAPVPPRRTKSHPIYFDTQSHIIRTDPCVLAPRPLIIKETATFQTLKFVNLLQISKEHLALSSA